MGQRYTINIIVVIVLTFVMYAYLRFSKQGYEISVVGEEREHRGGMRASTSAALRCARC